MPSKKSSRRKGYDPQKMFKRSLNTLTKGIIFSWVPGNKTPGCFDLQGNPFYIDKDTHAYIMSRPRHWRCLCMAVCKAPNGEKYIKACEVMTDGPHLHKDIANDLNIQHQKLIAEANDDHLIAGAWSISPGNVEIDLDIAEKTIDYMGVWKLKTGLEWKNG